MDNSEGWLFDSLLELAKPSRVPVSWSALKSRWGSARRILVAAGLPSGPSAQRRVQRYIRSDSSAGRASSEYRAWLRDRIRVRIALRRIRREDGVIVALLEASIKQSKSLRRRLVPYDILVAPVADVGGDWVAAALGGDWQNAEEWFWEALWIDAYGAFGDLDEAPEKLELAYVTERQ